MQQELLLILLLAVLSPIIGSIIGVLKRPSEKFMFNLLSFAGGIMLSVSFLNLIPESIRFSSIPICALGILLGVAVMFLLDKAIPHVHPELCTPEHGSEDYDGKQGRGRALKLTAMYLILGIFLHNFPEGMAIALGSVSGAKVGLVIALAIAIHNIPEGICTSAPYFYSTKKRLRSFLISSSTAIPILVGFLIATVIYTNISSAVLGLIIGATAGLMIYITNDKILPTSYIKKTGHAPIFSFILGILLVILLGQL